MWQGEENLLSVALYIVSGFILVIYILLPAFLILFTFFHNRFFNIFFPSFSSIILLFPESDLFTESSDL